MLERHGVAYVIVGGYAARMHGSMRPTRDVDVTPATTRENLDRLAAALRELDARIRTNAVPEGLPFSTSGEALAGHRMLNLQTRHGELDLTIRPAGFEGGYDELIGRSGHRSLGQIQVRVAGLRMSSAPKKPPRATRTFARCPSCTGWPIFTGNRRRS